MSTAEQIVGALLDETKPDDTMMKELSKVAIDAGFKWLRPGASFSRGTSRSQDIAGSLSMALEAIDRPALNIARNDYEEHFEALARVFSGSEAPTDFEYTDQLAFEILPDILQKHCLPFTYVGSHEGDGTDVGCWVNMESLEEAVEEGEVTKIEAPTPEFERFAAEAENNSAPTISTPYVWIHYSAINTDVLWTNTHRLIWRY